MAPVILPLAASNLNLHTARSVALRMLDDLVRRDEPTQKIGPKFPTVAIVLLAIVGVILLMGGFKLFVDAQSRRERAG